MDYSIFSVIARIRQKNALLNDSFPFGWLPKHKLANIVW